MDRHLELHNRHTPSGEFVVLPHHPLVPVDLDAGSELAARPAETAVAPTLQTDRLLERLGPRRLAEIRARLASGVYASPEIVGELAIRLMESGDLY